MKNYLDPDAPMLHYTQFEGDVVKRLYKWNWVIVDYEKDATCSLRFPPIPGTWDVANRIGSEES